MFDEQCSIYADALDNVGRFIDIETGECITQMSIHDFCLTDRWKPYVERLRALRDKFGDSAKKMPEYIQTKKRLPGATLSGLFDLRNDECVRRDGSKFVSPVSRRETHLLKHTGWLAIDIDFGDNANLSNFDNIRTTCSFRPEIALVMRSCSGTGYFGLVRLAYPDRHKEQFKALIKEYAALGIMLDKQCGNIGRVRFASWDDPRRIYINEKATPYRGLEIENSNFLKPYVPSATWNLAKYQRQRDTNTAQTYQNFWGDVRALERLTELVVYSLVREKINITEDYDDWCMVGWALKDHPIGERLFHELSACSSKYQPQQTALKWRQLGASLQVTSNYLYHICRTRLGEDYYQNLKRQVWKELRQWTLKR